MAGEELAEFLALYAQPFEADLEGAYLARVCSVLPRPVPAFSPGIAAPTKRGRDRRAAPPPTTLMRWCIETLKAATSYHRNYHAAFRWDARARLALVPCPVLLMASDSRSAVRNDQGTRRIRAGPPLSCAARAMTHRDLAATQARMP